jgi:mannose-6-phosphate isomerase-like protein (cupin superfamily)
MELLKNAGRHTASATHHWVDHLRVADLSVGTYSLPAGGTDPQSPHTEDEIYVCTGGRATLWTPTASAPLGPGDVAFVPAGEEHRFIDIEEDFTVIVIFGPAEHSRAGGPAGL